MIPAVAMTFAAVFLSIMAVFYAMNAARQSPAAGLKRRLQQLTEADEVRRPKASAIEITRGISPAEQFLFNLPLLNRLQRLLVQAGSADEFNHLSHDHDPGSHYRLCRGSHDETQPPVRGCCCCAGGRPPLSLS